MTASTVRAPQTAGWPLPYRYRTSHFVPSVLREPGASPAACRPGALHGAFWRNKQGRRRLAGDRSASDRFCGLAAIRRQEVVLGVRQDMPVYTARHPAERDDGAAYVLEGAFRLMSSVFRSSWAATGREYRGGASADVSVLLSARTRSSTRRARSASGTRGESDDREPAGDEKTRCCGDVMARLREHDSGSPASRGEGPMEGASGSG